MFKGVVKDWKYNLYFVIFSLISFSFEYYYQLSLSVLGFTALARSIALTGASFIGIALLLSSVFKYKPKYAKYWKVRRSFGVTGFVFGFIHYLVIISKYYNFNFSVVFYSFNPFKNPLIFGYLALIVFLPIFLTSTDWAVKKLKRNWKKLHQTVYVAYMFLILHFLLIKPDFLKNLAGIKLITITILVLFSRLYFFIKESRKRKITDFQTLYGMGIIVLYIIFGYIVFFLKF